MKQLTMCYFNNCKGKMMIKKTTQLTLMFGIGLSLFSGFSQAALTKTLLAASPRVSASARLGAIAVVHDDEGFSVIENGRKPVRVQNHLVDKLLRGRSQDDLEGFFEDNGHLIVNRGSDDKFSIRAGGGLNGGGPILAAVFYWTVKGAGYIGLASAVALSAGIEGKAAQMVHQQPPVF